MGNSSASTQVITFPAEYLAIPVVVAVIAFIVGIVFIRKDGKFLVGLGAIGAALLAGVLIGPAMFKDKIFLGPDAVTTQTGFWWAQTEKGIKFDDVDFIKIARRLNHKGRLKTIWEIHQQNGRIEEFQPSSLWSLKSDEIIQHLRANGVRFSK